MEPYNQLKKKRRIIRTKPSFCGSLTPIFQGVKFISRCHPFQKAWDQKCLSHFFHSWGSPATSEARHLGWNWWTGSVETGLFLQQKFSLKWNNRVIFHWSMMMGGRAKKHTDTHTHTHIWSSVGVFAGECILQKACLDERQNHRWVGSIGLSNIFHRPNWCTIRKTWRTKGRIWDTQDIFTKTCFVELFSYLKIIVVLCCFPIWRAAAQLRSRCFLQTLKAFPPGAGPCTGGFELEIFSLVFFVDGEKAQRFESPDFSWPKRFEECQTPRFGHP